LEELAVAEWRSTRASRSGPPTATARLEHLTLLTADERILGYPHVETLDARR
jgi:hypothetical protein